MAVRWAELQLFTSTFYDVACQKLLNSAIVSRSYSKNKSGCTLAGSPYIGLCDKRFYSRVVWFWCLVYLVGPIYYSLQSQWCSVLSLCGQP